MLGRLLLILVQLVIGWYASIEFAKSIPNLGKFDIFVMAAVFAVIIWAIGLLAGAILKDVAVPSSPTLLFAFGAAILFASLTVIPDVHRAIADVIGHVDNRVYPLIGAVIGYAIQN